MKDDDVMRPGTNYREEITAAVASSDVVLVLIGRQWLSPVPGSGKRRLDDQHDTVRFGIETALGSNRYLIPVLVEGAKAPSRAELPRGLGGLADRNALELSDSRWSYDVERLLAALENRVGK